MEVYPSVLTAVCAIAENIAEDVVDPKFPTFESIKKAMMLSRQF